MNIQPVSFPQVPVIDIPSSREGGRVQTPQQTDFEQVLGQALDRLDSALKEGDAAVAGFLQGRLDIQQMALALEKADISLRFMTHVRNRVVEAYREISRMNI